MIGRLMSRDHPVGDILHAPALDAREDRSPRAYAYKSSDTIICGSNAARPHPSSRYEA